MEVKMSKKEEANSREEFNKIISDFKKKYGLNDYELIDLILNKEKEIGHFIPIDAFNDKLGCLETVVKYFRENKGMSFKEMAELFGRSSSTVINSYNKAKKKLPESLNTNSNFLIPAEVFSNKGFSIFENLVIYLKEEHNLRFREIGKLISRNEKTIWTVYKRGVEKDGKTKS